MSVEINYYLIAGYDLTGMKTEKFEDWRWTKEGEGYFDYQDEGRIQLFDDPMYGEHLYFGYILASGNQYELPTHKIGISNISVLDFEDVTNELIKLKQTYQVIQDQNLDTPLQLILFEEAS